MHEIGWPNLYLIGAARSGTTTLFDGLSGHPDIFMSPAKEPGFMALGGALYDLEDRHETAPAYFVTSIEGYRALFRHWLGEKIVGDATPHYLHSPVAAKRIRHYAPDAHIVAILRSPAARSHSSYMMGVRGGGGGGKSFDEVMIASVQEPTAPAVLAGSLYAEPLQRYYDLFRRDQILVLLFDDLAAEPVATLQRLYGFLGVAVDHLPDMSLQANVSGVPRFPLVHRVVELILDHRIMKRLHRYGPRGFSTWLERGRSRYYARGLKREALPEEKERFYNRAYFRRDIEAVQELIGRDLSHWLA